MRACSPLPAVATSHSSGRSLTSKRRREAASSSTISTRVPLVCMLSLLSRVFTAETPSSQSFIFPTLPLVLSASAVSYPYPLSSIFDFVTQARGYFLDEYIFVDGLGDIAGTAGGQRFLPISLHRVGGHGYDRNISRGRLLL